MSVRGGVLRQEMRGKVETRGEAWGLTSLLTRSVSGVYYRLDSVMILLLTRSVSVITTACSQTNC